jgi:hypothetical protein
MPSTLATAPSAQVDSDPAQCADFHAVSCGTQPAVESAQPRTARVPAVRHEEDGESFGSWNRRHTVALRTQTPAYGGPADRLDARGRDHARKERTLRWSGLSKGSIVPYISERRFVRNEDPRARVWEAAMRPETLLDILGQGSPEYLAFIAPQARRFACWCARDAGAASTGALPHRVLHAAEKNAAGELSPALLAAERRSAAGLATGAGTIGLPRRAPSAALHLAAIRTADDNPFEAARAAAHYAALAVELRDGEAAGILMRLRQASALRFFILNPFIRDRRACA